jgi:hypothetical protein
MKKAPNCCPACCDDGINLVECEGSEKHENDNGAHDLKITEFETDERSFEAAARI